MSWGERQQPCCGACGRAGGSLFYIPGGWTGLEPLEGLCYPCGQGNPQFRDHFGEVRFVSDSDSGQATDQSS